MKAPEKSPRVLSPSGVEVKQDRVRARTERIGELFKGLDAAFDRIDDLLGKAQVAKADTSALEAELKEKEAELARLKAERAALADSSRELTEKRGRIAGLEKKSLDELFVLYEKRKSEYPKDGTGAVNKAGEIFQKALHTYTEEGKGADLLGDMVVPYEPQTDRVRGIIAGIIGTGVDFKPLETAIAAYDRLGEAYRKTPESDASAHRKADRAVREARDEVKKAFSACKEALEEGLRKANASGAAAGEPKSKTELREELVWIEHILAKKLRDPATKETYIVAAAMKEREALINKNIVEKLSDGEKQKRFVAEVVKSLGVPLTTDELRALFERRRTTARPAGGARRGGGSPTPTPATYTEDRFGEEIADEVLYQMDPNLITDNSAEVRRRLQDRRVPVPSPFSKKLLAFIGSAIDDGSRNAPLMKLGGNLTSLLQPKPEVPGETRSFKDVERGLDQIFEAVLTKLDDKEEAKIFLEVFKESEAARLGALDRRAAEAKVARLLEDAEKAEKIEQRATGIHRGLDKAAAFVDEDLADLDKMVAVDRKLQTAAITAHEKREAVRTGRAKGLAALEGGFDAQISDRQNSIEANNAAILKLDTETLTKLREEHDAKKAELEAKTVRVAKLKSLLAKIYDGRSDTFVLKDVNVTSTDADILRESDPSATIDSKHAKRGSKKGPMTALELIAAYKQALAEPFFEATMLGAYPAELTVKPSSYLRAESDRIKRKCELIEEGRIAAKVALGILANGPEPTFAAPGAKPLPQPKKVLVDWTAPIPGFFSAGRDAYIAWKKNRAADEKINRDRAENDANALREWQEKINKANRETAAWEDRLKALAKILTEQTPNLPQVTVDLTKDGDDLRQEVAAACIAALKPMILEHPLTAAKNQSTALLQAIKREIEQIEQADTEKYANVIRVINNASGVITRIQGMKAELTIYAKARNAERMQAEDDVEDLKAVVGPLEQRRVRLDGMRARLVTQTAALEAEKTTHIAEKAKQVAAFNTQTPILIEQADAANDLAKWKDHAYDYTEEQEELQKKAERIVLDLVKELDEWNRVAADYPEHDNDDSIAYSTAQQDVKRSMERARMFLSKRGDTVKDGLADIRALKTRLEQAFARDQRGRRENVAIRNEIYTTFNHLKEPLKKEAGTM